MQALIDKEEQFRVTKVQFLNEIRPVPTEFSEQRNHRLIALVGGSPAFWGFRRFAEVCDEERGNPLPAVGGINDYQI